MRFSFRFIFPIAGVFAFITFGILPLVDVVTFKWFIRDLDIRSKLIINTMSSPLSEFLKRGGEAKVYDLFNRAVLDERLYALGYCDTNRKIFYKTALFPAQVSCATPPRANLLSDTLRIEKASYRVTYAPIQLSKSIIGELIVVHDMAFIRARSQDVKVYIFYLFASLAVLVSFISILVAELSWKSWVSTMRNLIKRDGLFKSLSKISSPELKPLAKDLKNLIRDIEAERRIRDENQMSWTPKTLKTVLNKELKGDEILIVSNREPYLHVYREDKIEVQVPASGLVTALEPIMRACSGTWIAHGSGSADKAVVDNKDHVKVPPENPSYQIRRVWLTEEEEQGYYYGFANEGLWPLCHIAHTRPIFRTSDWNCYVKANEKFAKAVIEEATTENPVILVQDYHFALLPKMIREKLPKATIITFWHIPWTNPEAFGICPWRTELLDGLLGSSILGFHTRYHCNNFIDTVDRFLETRIDRDTSTISYGGKLTAVNSYPISIEWPVRGLKNQKSIPECRSEIRTRNNIAPHCRLGVGVDRMDYTKGILERFLSVERFLELNPEWIGKFSFVQIAAPSRTRITEYQNFEKEVSDLAKRINARFAKDGYEPILLKAEHHGPDQILEYFRGVDICFVSSLHDGMNLVAKEFVSARDDEQGVLILSQFTGAARELPESLIVNPYDIDQCASAISMALTMPSSDQSERMKSMRGLIQEYNVYRWAGRMLIDAARIRQRTQFVNRIKNSLDFQTPLIL